MLTLRHLLAFATVVSYTWDENTPTDFRLNGLIHLNVEKLKLHGLQVENKV